MQNQDLGEAGKELAGESGQKSAEGDAAAGFATLGQEFYKDGNGRDIAASEVDFLAPYKHIVDGFYRWECGRCRREDSSRSCGWPISGQVLKCSGCAAKNLLVRTNTIEISELAGKRNDLELGLMRLKSDRAAFDAEVQRAAANKVRGLESPLRQLLVEIEAQSLATKP